MDAQYLIRNVMDSASSLAAETSAAIAEYEYRLRKHDWEFEFSDDQRVWLRGRDERAQLNVMRRELDPDYTIWNRHAPRGHKLHRAA